MNLFELFVKIGADTSQAEKGMKDTQKNSETLTNKIKVMSAQFEEAQKNVDKLAKEFNESVKSTGAASKETRELAQKLNNAEKEAEQAKKSLDKYNDEVDEIPDKAEEAKKSIGDLSSWTVAKGQLMADAIKAVGKALLDLSTQAIKSYAEYEQLAGGAQKIFDQMDYSRIAQDAQNAYKELGLSANQYLAVINDVGATFAATMGDEAGYETAKTGLKAISDYASGTGKSVDELSSKFTLITRSTSSYQSIADQFSGILPATSEGFLKQAQSVGILSDSYTKLSDVPIAEYQAAVSKMLEKGVADLGLANNTVLESKTTISGSFAAMKSAADNFLVALVDDNADVGESFKNLAESVGAFVGNVTPKIWDLIGALGPIGPLVTGITTALVAFKASMAISKTIDLAVAAFNAYKLANEGATIAQWAMNAAMNANPIVLIVTLVAGLVAALITLWNTNDGLTDALTKAWEGIKKATEVVWGGLVKFFTKDIPNAFKAVINFVKNNWQSLLLFIVNPFAGALKMLYDLSPRFREWVDNVWQSIKEGFTKIVDRAKTWGKDLIQNFIDGIFAKWNALKETVSNVANTVKDFLGFSEPKKGPLSNFHTYAPDMMDLFIKGIRDNEKKLTDQIAKTFDFGEAQISAGVFYGRSQGIGNTEESKHYNAGQKSYGDIYINVEGANYSDPRELAEVIAEELQFLTDRKAAAYA